MTAILRTICFSCAVILLTGCDDGATYKKAEELLKRAQTQFENGQYDKASATIDSLRKCCPQAIEARKTALHLYQKIELRHSQLNVEAADKAIKMTEEEYNDMRQAVEELKAKGEITKDRLSSLTRMKLRLDSLKAVFDMECAKIRYIKKKMKE